MAKLSGKNIVVIGGCGHVGLPLGVKCALAGAATTLVDINETSIAAVNGGRFPFLENGGDEQLRRALKLGLTATTDKAACSGADVIVFVVGTPVDEHLNPKLSDVVGTFSMYQEYFRPGVLVVMRSTLYPGTMEHLYGKIKEQGLDVKLAFCPERVAQGLALDEIDSLPQIVSTFDDPSFDAAYELFAALAPQVIRLTPLEAEMTKLMTNSWRYLEFAIANQFYMIAESNGVDFHKVYQAIRYRYPRAQGYKAPGLTAGPCLFKDTMQLASYFDHQFTMGHSAMLVNEGLATFLVRKALKLADGKLWNKTVGILGMAFKADNDDVRDSLSFRVRKALNFHGATVVCHDPFVPQMSSSLEEVLEQSDLLMLCSPHTAYKNLTVTKPVVDVWGLLGTTKLDVLPGYAGNAEPQRRSGNE